jgi:hypothetical protein
VFAGSQRLPCVPQWKEKLQPGQFGVKLDYEPVAPDTGSTVQITLEHTVCVALANNEVKRLFEKGTRLPAKQRMDLCTVTQLKQGESGQLLSFPILQGENSRADRNRLVGILKIEVKQISRDVPAGSVIEVFVEIDESRQIKTKAFIPILSDENGWFENVIGLEYRIPKANELGQRIEKSKERLKGMREKANRAVGTKAIAIIQEIDRGCTVTEAERLVAAASKNDSDAAQQCDLVLLRLESKLDDVEDVLEWPSLVTEAKKVIADTREVVESSSDATPEDKREFSILEREAREAIEHRVPDLLRRRVDGLDSLRASVSLASSLNGDFRLIVKTRRIGSNGTAEIKGTISGPVGLLPRGFCLELVNEDVRPEWRSGWLPLDPTGDFCVTASVHSEARTNEFSVALRDGAGEPKKLVPNYFVTRA